MSQDNPDSLPQRQHTLFLPDLVIPQSPHPDLGCCNSCVMKYDMEEAKSTRLPGLHTS
jgi:hypothetical protein